MKNTILSLVILLVTINFNLKAQNNSLHFDGANDYCEGVSPYLADGDFTIETWFKSENTNNGFFNRIISINGGTTRIEIGEDNGEIAYFFHPDNIPSPDLHLAISNTDVRDGLCHHLAAVKSELDLIIYLDGVQVLFIGDHFSTGFFSGSGSSTLGTWSTTHDFWKGDIDEVRIWSDVRNSQQIIDFMNIPLLGSEPSLLAYYSFDQGIANGNNTAVSTLISNSINGGSYQLNNFTLSGNVSNWVTSCAPIANYCPNVCCSDNDVAGFISFPLGPLQTTLPSQTAGWYAKSGFVEISEEGCSDINSILTSSGNSGNNPIFAFDAGSGFAGPNILLENGKYYCISLCAKMTDANTIGTVHAGKIDNLGQFETLNSTSTITFQDGWTDLKMKVWQADQDYSDAFFKIFGSEVPINPLGLPVGMLIDNICISEVEAPMTCKADFTYIIHDCGEVCFTNTSCGEDYTLEFTVDGEPYNIEADFCPTFGIGTHEACLTIITNGCEDIFCQNFVVEYDIELPTITCPSYPPFILLEPNCELALVLDNPITTVDPCSQNQYLTCVGVPQNNIFTPGTTTITCGVFDDFGQEVYCSYDVIVECESPCCGTYENLCESFEAGYQLYRNGCSIEICLNELDTCQYGMVTINGNDSPPITDIAKCYNYDFGTSGDYSVTITIGEISDDIICFQKDTTFNVCVECECDNEMFVLDWEQYPSSNHWMSSQVVNLDVEYAGPNDARLFIAGGYLGNSFYGIPTISSGETDVFLAELNPTNGIFIPGSLLTFGGESMDNATVIKHDQGNNRIIMGGTSYSKSIVFPNGVPPLSNPYPYTGVFPFGNPKGHQDAFILSIDLDPYTVNWAINLSNHWTVTVNDLVVDDMGYIYATGQFRSGAKPVNFAPLGVTAGNLPADFIATSTGSSAYVVKYNSNGEGVWLKTFTDPSLIDSKQIPDAQTFGQAIDIDLLGNVYVSGEIKHAVKGTQGCYFFENGKTICSPINPKLNENGFILKLNNNGTIVWVEGYQDQVHFKGNAVKVHGDNLYVGGRYDDDPSTKSGFLAHYIDLGMPMPTLKLHKHNGYKIEEIDTDDLGNVYTTGWGGLMTNLDVLHNDPAYEITQNEMGERNGVVAKYTPDLTLIDGFNSGSSKDFRTALAVKGDGTQIVFGGNSKINPFYSKPNDSFYNVNGNITTYTNSQNITQNYAYTYFNAFNCICPSDPNGNCCDGIESSLVATNVNPNEPCCYDLDITNNAGFQISKIELDLSTANWVLSFGGLQSGYNLISNNNSIIIKHNTGVFPSGSIDDLINICLAANDPSAMIPQQIIIKYYENTNNGGTIELCRDTLITECQIIDIPESCLEVFNILNYCDSEDDNSYFINFDVKNLSNFNAGSVKLSGLTTGFGFCNCNSSLPCTCPTDILIPIPNSPLIPTDIEQDLCVKIVSKTPLLSNKNICFYTGFESPDLDICCTELEQICFTLEPCCIPCENTDITVETIPDVDGGNSSCCFALDLSIGCDFEYFSKIEIELSNPDAVFNYINNSTAPTLGLCPLNPPTDSKLCFSSIDPQDPSGVLATYIPYGLYDNFVEFCLSSKSGTDPISSSINITYFTQDLSGNEVESCTEILDISCSSDTNECLLITDANIECIEENFYKLTGTVTNVSSPYFTADEITVVPQSPYSTSILSPNIIPAPNLFTTGTENICVYIELTPNNLNQPIGLIFGLKNTSTNECCNGSGPIIKYFDIPECDTLVPLECPENLLCNGSITDGLTAGNLYPSGSGRADCWESMHGSPQVVIGDGCVTNGSLQMWGMQTTGESISQVVNFNAGKSYEISFCAKWLNQVLNKAQLRIRATNGPNSYTNCSSPNCEEIIITNDLSLSWNNYTTTCWTPQQDYSTLLFSVWNQYTDSTDGSLVSWARIDDVCVSECQTDCCENENFPQQCEDFLSTVIIDDCMVCFDPSPLDSCVVLSINWGDGMGDNYPIDNLICYEYEVSGEYDICIQKEVWPEIGDFPCISMDTCITVAVTCDTIPIDTCICEGFTDLKFYNLISGNDLDVQCNNQEPYQLECPDDSGQYWLHGNLLCTDSCGQSVDWNLLDDSGILLLSGTSSLTYNNPEYHFDLPGIPYLTFPSGGNYELELTGHCGQDSCLCSIDIIVPDCDCSCDGYSNVTLTTQDITYSLDCDYDMPTTLNFCPQVDPIMSYTGTVNCSNACMYMGGSFNWSLYKNGSQYIVNGNDVLKNITTMVNPSGNYFIDLSSVSFWEPGKYSINSTILCDGSTKCDCYAEWIVPDDCGCDCLFIKDLKPVIVEDLINPISSCKRTFHLENVGPCDVVEWEWGLFVANNIPQLATTISNNKVTFTGIDNTLYSISATVYRYKSDGTLCMPYYISKWGIINCGPTPKNQFYFDGLLHTQVGMCDIQVIDTITPNKETFNNILLSGMASNEEKGLDINLGETKGYIYTHKSPQHIMTQVGGYYEYKIYGSVDGNKDMLIRTIREEIVDIDGGKFIEFTTDSYGITQNWLRITAPDGNIMTDISIENGSHLYFRSKFFDGDVRLESSISASRSNFLFIDPTTIRLPDGTELQIPEGSNVEIKSINPTYKFDYYSHIEMRWSGISSDQIQNEKIIMFDDQIANYALGNIVYEAWQVDKKLGIMNPPQNKYEGVQISWPFIGEIGTEGVNHEIVWTYTKPELPILPGLIFEPWKEKDSLSHYAPGRVEIKSTLETDYIIFDKGDLESENIVLQLYNQGTMVQEFTVASDFAPIQIEGTFPNKVGNNGNGRDLPFEYELYWINPISFYLNDSWYIGDELRIVTEETRLINLGSFNLIPYNFKEFTITEESLRGCFCDPGYNYGINDALALGFTENNTGNQACVETKINNIKYCISDSEFTWNWGDGTTSTTGTPPFSQCHTYADNPDNYVITFTAKIKTWSNLCEQIIIKADGTSGTLDLEEQSNWVVYPNPTTNSLTVKSLKPNNANKIIELYDITGRKIKSIYFSNQDQKMEIDMNDIHDGVFLLNVVAKEGIIFRTKIIKI